MQDQDDALRRQLRDSVATFVQRNPGAARIRRLRTTETGFDAVAWAGMAEAGWHGIAVPEAQGGLGLGVGELCAVAEELGAGLAPEPFLAASLATVIAAAGGRGADLCAGTRRAALAWQEAENTLDPLEIATVARALPDGIALSGRKRFIPAASGCDAFVVTALAADGLAAWWVPADSAGLRLEGQRAVDGSLLGTLHLEDVRLPAEARLHGVSAATLARALDETRLAAGFELFGLLRRALAMTVQYSKDRAQFGKPIGAFQVLQHRMVDLWMQQEVTRATLADARATFARTDDPGLRAVAASAAKARASAAALLVTRQAIQIHGGIGYADEHDIGLFLKRAIVLSAWLGSAATHRRRFGQLAPDWDGPARQETQFEEALQ